MKTTFNLWSDEQIVFQTHRKRAWYDILGTILLTGFLLFVFSFVFSFTTVAFGYSRYAGFYILLILAVGADELISRLISEVTLTNRRILVKGVPNSWTHFEVPLDQVQSMTTALGGMRIKQKNRWLARTIYISKKREFMDAYSGLIKQGDHFIPPVIAQISSAVTGGENRAATLPPASPPTSVQHKAAPEIITGDNKKCPICAETIKAEAKICRFCRARFEVHTQAYCPQCSKVVSLGKDGRCPDCNGEVIDPHLTSMLIGS